MPITLQSILQRSLRIAGITIKPGVTPSNDQLNELVAEMNAMLSSWSCNGHRIHNVQIAQYGLTAEQKVYTIGPGADLDGPRPVRITWANIVSSTDPTYRTAVAVTTDPTEWGRIQMQDETSSNPNLIYYDNSIDENGWARIYIHPQAQTGFSLELIAWMEIDGGFTAVSDVVMWPPGYEDAVTWNFALRTAAMNPHEAKILPIAFERARETLYAITTLRMISPVLRSEAANLNGERTGRLSGSYGPSGGGGTGVAPTQYSTSAGTITGDMDGTNLTFTLSSPVSSVIVVLNGSTMTPGLHYIHTSNQILFISPFIPQPGSDILVLGWT